VGVEDRKASQRFTVLRLKALAVLPSQNTRSNNGVRSATRLATRRPAVSYILRVVSAMTGSLKRILCEHVRHLRAASRGC
jgi:hypothetical protein